MRTHHKFDAAGMKLPKMYTYVNARHNVYLAPTAGGRCVVTLVMTPLTLGTKAGLAAMTAPRALPPSAPKPNDRTTLSAGCSMWLRLKPAGALTIACNQQAAETDMGQELCKKLDLT